jgi:branched-chain amino acid transport system ATP-binding protein
MADALALRGVRAGYGETVVLDDVNLELPSGRTLAVLGRNGVGKSTLLATIMGHTSLHHGQIFLSGSDISSTAIYNRVRSGLGYVPQEREIFSSLTVRENLTVAARPGRWDTNSIFELFPSLADRQHNLGTQLSGGEQQMLAVGRALMGNPSVLLLDEPLEGLAPVIIESLMHAFERLRADQGLTIVFVEQHTNLALEFAVDAVVLDRGSIVYNGPSNDLLRDTARLDVLVGVAREDSSRI